MNSQYSPQYSYPYSYPYPPPTQSNNGALMFGGVIVVIVVIIICVLMYTNITSDTSENPVSTPSSSPSSPSRASRPTTGSPSSSSPSSGSPSTGSPSSGPPSIPSVDCEGDWQICSKPCGDGEEIYKITTPKKGEGKSCPEVDGKSKPCKIKDCPVNCEGDWGDCSTTCGEGIKRYKIKTHKKGDGQSCSHGEGASQTCTAGNYILDCPANHDNFKKFFKAKFDKASFNMFPFFTFIPINSQKVSETLCNVELQGYVADSASGAPIKKRFTLLRNNDNCTWSVTDEVNL